MDPVQPHTYPPPAPQPAPVDQLSPEVHAWLNSKLESIHAGFQAQHATTEAGWKQHFEESLQKQAQHFSNTQNEERRQRESVHAAEMQALQHQVEQLTSQLALSGLQTNSITEDPVASKVREEDITSADGRSRAASLELRLWRAPSHAVKDEEHEVTIPEIFEESEASGADAGTQVGPMIIDEEIDMQPETPNSTAAPSQAPRRPYKSKGQAARATPLAKAKGPASKGATKRLIEAVKKPTRSPRGPPKKPKSQINRLMRHEVPPDALTMQRAINVHVCLIWRLHNRDAIPSVPPPEVLAQFERTFSTRTSVLAAVTTGHAMVAPNLVEVLSSYRLPGARATIKAQLLNIEDSIIEYIQAYMARVGMVHWCPDLRQTPHSLWNDACRIVAINTFKAALSAHAYDALGVDLQYTTNTALLLRFYDQFVHHHQQRRFNLDALHPGRVQTKEKLKSIYKNRTQLANARASAAVDLRLPMRYRVIFDDAKAMSDDEWDPAENAYIIKKKEGRSAAAEKLIRGIDVARKELALLSGKWHERLRIFPEQPQMSTLRTLPSDMPYDYFDKDFWNRLPAKLKSSTTRHLVAFPPNPEDVLADTPHPAEAMRTQEFMETYGREIMSQYKIPRSSEEDSDEDDVDWYDFEDESVVDDEDAEMLGPDNVHAREEREEFAAFLDDGASS